MISVVIPLYNKEQSIASTLQTVLKQTYQNFEIVIVNDGSTDRSVEEVKRVLDPRIHLIHQNNAGVSAARNRGIEEAKGEFIAFLDADDEWKPEYLETQLKLTQKYPQCSIFACNYEFKDSRKKISPTIIRKLPFKGEDGILSNYFEVASYSDPPICSISIMVRTKDLKAINGFPLGIKSGEDLLTWARMACQYRIAYSIFSKSIYCLGYSNPRPPENKDYVGEQLEILHKNYPNKIGLKKYVAFWYKMRMCRCLAHKMWKNALTAWCKSLRYNPFQGKIYLSIAKYTLIGLK